ncbi:MCE family protein [Actinophytocola sp.]|uniref:MCE family protein n=1 Tax=Actinophytocola sp. TaxID=1872138 RepID=UPI0039C86F5E
MITRKRLAVLLGVLVLVTAGNLWWIFVSGGDDKRITAWFTRAVGVYAGTDVQVLGVRVGSVESVTPRGEQVELVLTIDADAPVAADTRAVVVSPSVVADRHVQLTTLSHGAARIADGATIPASRTATPVELDELYTSLNDLLTALGPNGANANGALSDLLTTGAANLRGNGEAFNENVRNFAELAKTLAGYQDDLFGTVDELQKFTGMLAGNDRQVAEVNQQLAQVWQTLASDRDELSGALHTLAGALGEIQGFIRDNRAAIKSNVDKLAQTTQTLVDQRAALAEALDVAPLAVTNVLNAFDPASDTLQGRTNLEYYLPLPVAGQVYSGGVR